MNYFINTAINADVQDLAETDLLKFESDCEAKIKKNQLNILQFRENTGRISDSLKTKYDKKVAELEQKNNDLRQKIEIYKADRDRRLNKHETEQRIIKDSINEESRPAKPDVTG